MNILIADSCGFIDDFPPKNKSQRKQKFSAQFSTFISYNKTFKQLDPVGKI